MVIAEKQPSDAPPAYSHSASSSSRITPSTPSGPVPAPPIAPCNQLTIEHSSNKVEGVFVVQPDFSAAEELLAPMSTEETEAGRRANLRLSGTYGGVQADIWVLDAPDAKKPTWLFFNSTNKGSTIRIHSTGRAPCKIDLLSTYATSKLQLPRDWHGMLTVRRQYGTMWPLPAHRVTPISDIDGVLRCFVGDISLLVGNSSWEGNTLDVDITSGTLKLNFSSDPPAGAAAANSSQEGTNGKKGLKWSWWPAIGFTDRD